MTRFSILKEEIQEGDYPYFTPWVTKFSPYTHLLSVTGANEGVISCAYCNKALRNNAPIQKPISPVKIATNTIYDIVFTCEKTICVGSADWSVTFMDLERYVPTNVFYTNVSVKTLCNSINGNVFSGGMDGVIYEWSQSNKGPTLSIDLKKNQSVTSIIKPNDKMIIASYSGGQIVAWDLRNYSSPLVNIPLPDNMKSISSLALSPDKQLMASISTNSIVTLHKIDGEWGTIQRQSQNLDSFFNKICFSPCGNYLLTGSKLGALNIFPINPKIPEIKLLAHSGAATYIDWDESYDYIISCSDDATIQLWKANYDPITSDQENHRDEVDIFEDKLDFQVPRPKKASGGSSFTLFHYYQPQ